MQELQRHQPSAGWRKYQSISQRLMPSGGMVQSRNIPQLSDVGEAPLQRPWEQIRENAMTPLLTIALVTAIWAPLTVKACQWIAEAWWHPPISTGSPWPFLLVSAQPASQVTPHPASPSVAWSVPWSSARLPRLSVVPQHPATSHRLRQAKRTLENK